MEVCRQVKVFVGSLRVSEWDGMVRTALVAFDEHQQFAEDFGEVAPVDFINDEEPIAVRVIPGKQCEVIEHTVTALQAGPGRSESDRKSTRLNSSHLGISY